MAKAKKIGAREIKRLRYLFNTIEKQKNAQNTYYHIIQKAKTECW